MPFRRATYTLTPPTWPVFAISALLALLGALIHYRVLIMPPLAPYAFELVLVAVILLLAGALLRGI